MDIKVRVNDTINIKWVVGMITSRIEQEEIPLVKDDTFQKIDITVLDGDEGEVAYNLTGCLVNFYIKKFGELSHTNINHEACTITDAVNGKCQYQLSSGDLPKAGTYYADIVLVKGTNKMTIPEPIRLDIREKNV